MDSAWAPIHTCEVGSKEFQLSEGNDFGVVLVVEKDDWYEDVLRPA